MARRCTVCAHPDRDEIDTALVMGRSVRAVAEEYGLQRDAVHRHARNHLPGTLAAAASALPELQRVAPGMRRALDLNDAPSAPAAPTVPISESPIAPNAPAAPDVPSAAPESSTPLPAPAPPPVPAPVAPTGLGALALAHHLRDRAVTILTNAEASGDAKTALAAIREARGTLETLVRLEPPPAPEGVDIAASEEWTRVRTALIAALTPYPEARLAVAEALAALGAGSAGGAG